jgi:peptidoglycan/LPS O-acetylase OafA/YrhL
MGVRLRHFADRRAAADGAIGMQDHSKRLESIQAMRGFAAVMVMLFHFTNEDGTFLSAFPSLAGGVSCFAPGVWMFFAISGFVIPHAMASIDYRIGRDAWLFLVRRLIRLEPTYVAAVLLAVVIAYAASRTPGFHGEPFRPTLGDFGAQFLYLADWLNVPWFDAVAWSLAIEFQYYLLMLIAAPLLLARRPWLNAIFFAAVIGSSVLINDGRAVFAYLPCFAVGFVVFLFYHRRIGPLAFWLMLILFVALTEIEIGTRAAISIAVSAFLILAPISGRVPLFSFLGTISYSLYLVHGLIGGPIIHLAMRLQSHWMWFAGLIAAIAASTFSAVAMWYFVERPSQESAKAIGLGSAAAGRSYSP